MTEAYQDGDAFAAHLAAPYGAVFNGALGPLIVEDGSVLTLALSGAGWSARRTAGASRGPGSVVATPRSTTA